MENLKYVIVSQPPAMYNQASLYKTAAHTAPVSSVLSIPIENYKGILLCDRPAGCGGNGVLSSDGSAVQHPCSFMPSNPTGNPTGSGPSAEAQIQREQRQRMLNENNRRIRMQTCEAMIRHRRWLRSFANHMKEAREKAELSREVETVRSAATATQRAARSRCEVPSNNTKNSSIADDVETKLCAVDRNDGDVLSVHACASACAPTNSVRPDLSTSDTSCDRTAEAVNKSSNYSDVFNIDNNSNNKDTLSAGCHRESKATRRVKNRKPAWAMTENEALEHELSAHADLVHFADNLDYDRFINDMEVSEALRVMHDRVQQIVHENRWKASEVLAASLVSTDNNEDAMMTLSSDCGASRTSTECVDGSVNVARAVYGNSSTANSNAYMHNHNGSTDTSGSSGKKESSYACHSQAWDSSTGILSQQQRQRQVLRRAIGQDLLRLADRMLASSASLQRVYTRHSLCRKLQDCVLRGEVDVQNMASFFLAQAGNKADSICRTSDNDDANGDAKNEKASRADPCVGAVVGPSTTALDSRTVTIRADAIGRGAEEVVTTCSSGAGEDESVSANGAASGRSTRVLRQLQMSKERTQGLPYMYRCPAI